LVYLQCRLCFYSESKGIDQKKDADQSRLTDQPKIADQNQDQFDFLSDEITNPLLSSLGTSGQRFLTQIENYHYHEPGPDLFSDPLIDEALIDHNVVDKTIIDTTTIDTTMDNATAKNSMLTVLQSDILNLVHRKDDAQDTPVPVSPSDTSICIHACHSPMREAQVLKDLLLDAFAKDTALAPHDVIVMMPDIESYAPFIESVFSLEQRVPFSISDRKTRSESESLEAFLMILSLEGSRLEQSQLLDLMAYESIALKFGFETSDLTHIEKMLADSSVLWGKDGEHRERLGVPGFKENTWQFGLERLFMGMAMPEAHDLIVNGVLPCESFEGSDLEVLGKLAGFCSSFFSCLTRLEQPKTIEKWCETLRYICDSMIGRHPKNNSDLIFLYQQIDAVKTGADEADFHKKIPFDIIQSLMIQQLDLKVSQGKFLAGKITFCNIMPMRSIPYKIVVLMGMDEGAFPRQVFGPGFNLMEKYPRLGDKNERLEDRYLFLETLISVRQQMIITYTGLDIRDNSPIPCSGVVSELMDVMEQSFDFPQGFAYHTSHPLHPFNPAYFSSAYCNPAYHMDKGSLFSYSHHNFQVSTALMPKVSGQKASMHNSMAQTDQQKTFFMPLDANQKQQNKIETAVDPTLGVSMDEFIRYFRHPVEWMMKHTLKIGFPHLGQEIRDREVFSISGLDQYALGSSLIEKQSVHQDIAFEKISYYSILKAMGHLPYGQKGKSEYEKLQLLADPVMEAAQPFFLQKKYLPIVRQVSIENMTINVHLKDVREDGLILVSFGKLNSTRLLTGWIQHLFLNACAPKGYPKQTCLIGRDPNGKKPLYMIEFKGFEHSDLTARTYLTELVRLFNTGINQPLCFFCDTSFQFAKAMVRHHYEINQTTIIDAKNRAQKTWEGGYLMRGEKDNRYIDLCFSDNDPFETLQAFQSSGFIHNALTVFRPMLDHMQVIS